MSDQDDTGQPLLNDTDRLFSIVSRAVGVILGMLVVAVATSFALFYVRQDETISVFAASTLAWFGYLFAHYAATGRFIDQRPEQHMFPSSRHKIIAGVVGVLVVTAGVTIWIVSLGRGDLVFSIVGACIFLLGYLIAHYEFTGELL